MEKNFDKNQICADMAGWVSLEYIDAHQIIKNYKFNGKIMLTLASGKSFHYIDIESVSVGVNQETGGFSVSVEAQFNGQCTADGQELYDMQKSRFVLRLTDNNDIQWIAGCKEAPLRVSIDDQRDGDATGASSYTLYFSGKTWWPLMKVD